MKTIRHFKYFITLSAALLVFCTCAPAEAQFWDFFKNAGKEAKYDFKEAELLSQVIIYVRENYVEPSNIKPRDMFLKSLEYIELEVPQILVNAEGAPERVIISSGKTKEAINISDLDHPWQITVHIRQVFRFISENIKLSEKEQRNVEYAAINGMLATLDPHSVFLTPKNFKEVSVSTSGEFGGLGIVISIRDNALTVISPISGTPAAKAGIKAQDKITRIGDESTVNMALDEAVERLRGKRGTKVSIWVLREGWSAPRKFVLTRDIIKIQSVSSKLLSNGIGYLQIKSFQRNTFDDLTRHITTMRKASGKKELTGLILDLRNNPGGLLDQAIYVADFFLKDGAIVITEGGGKKQVEEAENQGYEPSCPIIVLMNGGSASASEIVAGALKNHKLGLVMGQQSFGKGTVQILYDDFADKSALKLTVAQYLTPGNISIQGVGITPDIVLSPLSTEKDGLHLSHDSVFLRESNLEHSLSSDKTEQAKAARPALTVDYLYKKLSDEEEAKRNNNDEFVSDTEIEIAQKLLSSLKIRPATKATILQEAADIMTKVSSDEETAIAESLRKLGIDWRTCPEAKDLPAGQFKADVLFSINPVDKEGNPIARKELMAGDSLKLNVKVKNTGKAPFCRLRAKTKADSGLFNRREFVFGYLPAGASGSWDYTVEVPSDTYAWNELVELSFEEDNNHIPAHPGLQVAIKEIASPQFSMQYRLVEKTGNGDDLLDVGERFDLELMVKNISISNAENVTVAMKNEGGKELFLDIGRFNLEKLAPNETKKATLSFEVREAAIDGAHIKLSVFDTHSGEYLTEEFKWPIQTLKAKDTGKPAPIPAFSAPIDAPSISLPAELLGSYTDKESITVSGVVNDKDPPLDVYIFVNNQKSFYSSLENYNSDANKKYRATFDANLQLKEGPNIITIIARESKTLIRRKSFTVYRQRKGPRVENEESFLLQNSLMP